MRTGEIVRIIILIFLGAGLMFLLQPYVYTGKLVRLLDIVRIEAWVDTYYIPGAMTVFGASVSATLIWYIATGISKASRAEEVNRWRLMWWLLGLLPLVSIVVAIVLFHGSEDAIPTLSLFFVLDGLWLYWLTTATSSSGLFMLLPPLSQQLRRYIP